MVLPEQVVLFNSDDIIAVPVITGILLWILQRLKYGRYRSNPVKKLIIPAFLFKVVLTLIGAYIADNSYSYKVDTHNYFAGVLTLKEALLEDPTFIQYAFFHNDDLYALTQSKPEVSWMMSTTVTKVAQIALPFSFFMGNSYLAISILFSFLAFYGVLKLFDLFAHDYPHLSLQFGYSFFFFPSFAFWSCGLLKDPLSIFGLGLFAYNTYSLLIIRRKIIQSAFKSLFGLYIVFIIKPYIAVALVPAFAIWIFRKYNEKIKSKVVRVLRSFTAFIIFFLILIFSSSYIAQSESVQQFAVENVLEEVKRQKEGYEVYSGDSNFNLGEFNPTPLGFAKLFPVAVYTALYRPFLWEVSKPIQFMSAIESFFFIIFTVYVLYKIGIKKFWQNLYSNNTIFFCFIFTFIFAGFVAVSTANFGTLVRYKIPCLPFYLAALIILLSVKRNNTIKK